MMIKIVVSLLTFVLALASIPRPDTSSECLQCKAVIEGLDIVWTNVTTVDMILKELEVKCIAKYDSAVKVKICQDVAKVFVQIPPSLFSGMEDLAWPIPEATCATIMKCHVNCCGERSPPEQVHLSMASNDRSIMGVTWVTLSQNRSVVQYGLSKFQLTNVDEGTIGTYKSGGWIGSIHRATMHNLKPSTTYFYRIGNGDDSWSETFSFTTLTPGQDVTFGIMADIDFESNITMANMISLVEEGKVQVLLINGDQSYADGYEPHWDVFFNRIQPMAARVPLMVTPGNHEFWYNFSGYKHRYFMPGVVDEGGSGDGMFYSMNVGHSHIIMGNSETAIDTANFSSSFLHWMEADLKAVDRVATPAVMAFFHRPMYCSNDDSCTSSGGNKLRKEGEEILYGNGVDLVVTSHIHSYERMYPMYNGSATQFNYESPKAPTYIVMGASGNREGNKGPYHDVPDWSAANDQSVAFVLMTVTPSKIDWSFFASRDAAEGGPVLKDSFVITL